MSKAQSDLPASDAGPTFPDSVQDHVTALIAAGDRKSLGTFGLDNGADPAEHSLLSRPAAPQGRRSLFRR